jgi:CHASE2 domain-containing sensor protein
MAELVSIIAKQKPKVIGFDVLYGSGMDLIDTAGTQSLANILKIIDNDIFACGYRGRDENGLDVVEGQTPLFKPYIVEGLVNFNISTDDPNAGTVRSYYPLTKINQNNQNFFGSLVASAWNKNIAIDNSEVERFIRWYGYGNRVGVADSLTVFKTFDWSQIQNHEFETKDFKGKIVLLGLLGVTLEEGYVDDEFYTPLNSKTIGRSLPDMYGVEVHANIIKMIIEREFIFHSHFVDVIYNYSLIIIFVFSLIWVYRKFEKQYSILSKIFLIVFIDALAFSAIGLFIQSGGSFKILIGRGLLIMLFLPDTLEFLENNLFSRIGFLKEGDKTV